MIVCEILAVITEPSKEQLDKLMNKQMGIRMVARSHMGWDPSTIREEKSAQAPYCREGGKNEGKPESACADREVELVLRRIRTCPLDKYQQ
jgi:hypothetical protein